MSNNNYYYRIRITIRKLGLFSSKIYLRDMPIAIAIVSYIICRSIGVTSRWSSLYYKCKFTQLAKTLWLYFFSSFQPHYTIIFMIEGTSSHKWLLSSGVHRAFFGTHIRYSWANESRMIHKCKQKIPHTYISAVFIPPPSSFTFVMITKQKKNHSTTQFMINHRHRQWYFIIETYNILFDIGFDTIFLQ